MDDWFQAVSRSVAPVSRDAAAQAEVDAATARMALYHYDSCMYCARVRQTIAALGLKVDQRDVLRDARHQQALVAGGGRSTVPCLRIDGIDGGQTRWMYESAGIMRYLNERFGPRSAGRS